jgi:carbonic anhydrase
MSVVEEVVESNEAYASRFEHGELPMPPARKLSVVTCMDARLDPAKFLGLDVGDAHVIRNAGGVVSDDALRSLVISHHLLGTQEALVIAHTDCGMLTFTNDDLRSRLGPEAEQIDFLPFPELDASVRESVRRIEESSLLPASFTARGFVYDVGSGRLREVD